GWPPGAAEELADGAEAPPMLLELSQDLWVVRAGPGGVGRMADRDAQASEKAFQVSPHSAPPRRGRNERPAVGAALHSLIHGAAQPAGPLNSVGPADGVPRLDDHVRVHGSTSFPLSQPITGRLSQFAASPPTALPGSERRLGPGREAPHAWEGAGRRARALAPRR